MPSLLPQGMKKRTRRDFSGDPDEFRLTLVEHLEELRDRLIRSFVYISAGWLVGWIWFAPIYGYLGRMVNGAIVAGLPKGHTYREIFDTATEPFFLKFKLSFLVGVIISFPFLIIQIWGFIAPGLKPNEQKPFRRLAPASALLFVMGAGFAWWVMPGALKWLVSYLGEFEATDLFQHAGTMIFFVLKMLLAFGFSFQLPLVVYGLGLAGLLSAETLLKYWRQSAVAIFTIAMIVTPSQDPATMLAMAVPLVILFMISVYLVKFMQRGKPIGDDATYTTLE